MSGDCLTVQHLRVENSSGDPVVADVSLSLSPGEILGLVGESGSGKTTTALSVLGWFGDGLRRTAGEVRLLQEDISESSVSARGRLATYVPQNPGTALNPALRIGAAIRHMIDAHRAASGAQADELLLLGRVGLPETREFSRRYRHQLSGGQQQRVCIAIAMASAAPVVILDEPTTGLDVVTQAKVLEELQRIRLEQNVSMIYVSHDLAVVAQIADRVAVMYAGHIVEQGPVDVVLREPRHPYTRGLIASIPDHLAPAMPAAMPGVSAAVGDRGEGCAFYSRCPVRIDRCHHELPELGEVAVTHDVRCFQSGSVLPAPVTGRSGRTLAAVDGADAPLLVVDRLSATYPARGGEVVGAKDVSFDVRPGECVALVGESGSGKTTIARAIAGLHHGTGGRVLLRGEALRESARKRTVEQRRLIQMVFQNPGEALNPRHSVSAILERPLGVLLGLRGTARTDRVAQLLDAVRLPRALANRYPRELSGGERQRVGIARALAADPQLIVCDEVTSALDVSVQAAVLNLIDELRASLGVSFLFITHDFGVVAAIADRVLVLEDGLVCEQQATRDLLLAPAHPYTARLLNSAPSLSTALAVRRTDPHTLGGHPRTATHLEESRG